MGRPPSRTLRKLVSILGFAALGVAVVVYFGTLIVSAVGEYRWRTYQMEATENGISMTLLESGKPIPAGKNLAGGPPFAPVRLGDDGNPVDLPTLKCGSLPLSILPEPMSAQRTDFAAARKVLAEMELNLPMESEPQIAAAILAACDRQLGDQWKAVLAAEAKPDVWFNVSHSPFSKEKVPVADFRLAAQTHVLRAVALLRLGKSKEAWAEVLGALRLADALGEEPTFIAFMLRAALTKLQMNCVWEGLAGGAWSDAELTAMEQRLSGLSVSQGYDVAIDAERGWVNSMLDQLVTQSVVGVQGRMWEWVAARDSVFPFPLTKNLRRWVVRDNQLLLNQHYDAVREHIDVEGNWQETSLPLAAEKASGAGAKRYPLVALAMVDFTRSESRLLCVESSIRQARLAIALERYRRSRREFPPDLLTLVPSLLPEVPLDPFDGGMMRYARDTAISYRLWSIGGDFEDDEGKADEEMVGMTLDMVWPGFAPKK